MLSDDAKLSFRKSGGKVLKVDVRCALQRSTSGSDQTEKSRSQVKLWGERWHEHNVGTYVLPDGKSRGHGWTCLGWSKYTIIGILSLLWKKKHLRIDSRRENQWDKNDFPPSRFARWPGQRQALGCFLFKLARYDGNKKCIKRIVKAVLSLVILPLF